MCTVLGWVQGWWSVTGLAIEITGFSALSLDVAREYDRHRMVERYRAGAAAAQRLLDALPSSDDSETPVMAESSSADAERDLAKDFHSLQERNAAMIDRGSAILAWYHSLPRSERKNYDPYSPIFLR
jgi:hypothetical protein